MAQDFTGAWNLASHAAQAAGMKWLEQHQQPAYVVKSGDRVVGTMLDVCGRCYVETKLNTAFGRWVKKNKGNGGVDKWLHFRNSLEGRQEMGLHTAMATAAKASLESWGITGLSLYSWVD